MRKTHTNQNPSQALGTLLRQKREELGYSKNQLARAAGVRDSTVLRFEQGEFVAPRPDKLARFAQLLGLSLGLSLADLYDPPWVRWTLPRFDSRGTGWCRRSAVCTTLVTL